MLPEQWLQQVGTEYLARVKAEEPQFLIEIDVSDDRLEEIFHHLSRVEPTGWVPEKRICLTLAAVHSAARADEGEERFREVFYRRLHREFKHAEWSTIYGPSIVAFLKDWFAVEIPDSGPHRYVGAIYRHAGIPIPARASFCRLLSHLWKNGVAFTRNQYFEAVRKTTSKVAGCFLESQAGYDFAQTITRFVARWERGQISAQELSTFPSYRRSLYEAVLSELHRMPPRQRSASATSYPPPILALDLDTRRLVIKFDAKGVASHAYRTNSGPVYYPTQPVTGSAPLWYSIRPETQRNSVSPWWVPGGTTSALFRTSDGALVDITREVSAGTYYLVTATPEVVPHDIILEEGSYLAHETTDASGNYYHILYIELSPGYEIPELSIRTKGTAAPPILKFENPSRVRHPLGGEVFVTRLPVLYVVNRTPDFDRRYWLWFNDGSGEKKLQLTSDGSGIEVPVPCPSQGTIWLEPKGYIRDEWMLPRLTFTVVPRAIDIRVLETLCSVHEPAHLQVRLPAHWKFEPKTQLQRIRPDLWQISADDRVVDAVLSYRDIKFSISLRVPRGDLWFNAHREDGAILWREDLVHDVPVRIEGLPDTRCSILLDSGSSTLTVHELHLPASGTQRISLGHFRDALSMCGFGVAEFLLQIGEHHLISTDRYFARADAIVKSLSEEPYDSMLFRLPRMGNDLLQARYLLDRTHASVSFSALDIPNPLRSFFCGLACAARELDGSAIDGVPEEYKACAPDSIRSIMNWIQKVKNSRPLFEIDEKILATFPAHDVAKLPAQRWRDAVNRLFLHLRHNQNVHELVRQWRQAIEDPDKEHVSELLKRPGGRDLMEATRRYHDAFSQQGKTHNEILTRSIRDLRRLLNTPALDPLVRMIASAFLQLSYYRSDRLQDAAALSIPDYPPSLERLASSMRALAARCQGKPVSSLSAHGFGFADISTRSEDALLERELENSSRAREDYD